VRQTLDLALTPRNIKAGFQATGISPFNPNVVFVDSDFVQAVVTGENDKVIAAEPEESNIELQRRIVTNVSEVAPHEEASTSLSSILSSVGPLCASTPGKKSNRGRKSMKSCILTSPENISEAKRKGEKKIGCQRKSRRE